MICRKCQNEIADNSRFCPQCGAAQSKICQNCKTENTPESTFCTACGSKLKSEQKQNKSQVNSPRVAQKSSSFNFPNPFILISVAAVLAIIGIFLVLSSNLPKEEVAQKQVQQSDQALQMMQQITDLKKMLQENPESAHLNVQMGNNLFDIQRYREAIPYYRKALKIDSKDINVHIDLAVSYFNSEIADTAIMEMKKALQIDPTHVKGLFNIGIMYYNTGNVNEAKVYWNKLIQLHAGTQEAETAKQLMQNNNS